MNIEERVQHYASSYSGILPNVLIESSKEWWRKELEEVAEEAEKRGFARGQLAEIEANAVSDITIAKEKVEQIREEALDGRKEEMEEAYEAGRRSVFGEVKLWAKEQRRVWVKGIEHADLVSEYNDCLDDLIKYLTK